MSLTSPPPTQHHLVPQPPRAKYVGSNDELVLEDRMQRAALCGNIPSDDLVTGIVAAVLGKELRNGTFEVEDYCFAGVPEQEDSAAMETDNGDDRSESSQLQFKHQNQTLLSLPPFLPPSFPLSFLEAMCCWSQD